jgi:hypothetical protein
MQWQLCNQGVGMFSEYSIEEIGPAGFEPASFFVYNVFVIFYLFQ